MHMTQLTVLICTSEIVIRASNHYNEDKKITDRFVVAFFSTQVRGRHQRQTHTQTHTSASGGTAFLRNFCQFFLNLFTVFPFVSEFNQVNGVKKMV